MNPIATFYFKTKGRKEKWNEKVNLKQQGFLIPHEFTSRQSKYTPIYKKNNLFNRYRLYTNYKHIFWFYRLTQIFSPTLDSHTSSHTLAQLNLIIHTSALLSLFQFQPSIILKLLLTITIRFFDDQSYSTRFRDTNTNATQ